MLKRILLTLFVLLIPVFCFSQASDFGAWYRFFGNKQIDQRWNWHQEFQYRNFNLIGDTEQLLFRTGIGYNLTEGNNNVLAGYAYIYNEPYIGNTNEKTSFGEHRTFQQFITRQVFGRASLLHRYRFEQRFFSDDFRLRLRYFLAINIALNNKQMQDKTVYLSFYNEVFVNTEDPIFDRNRFYGGFGYRFSKHLRNEIAIMNQTTAFDSRNQLNIKTFINF
ncbi:MAG: DUF2490 domain-containing protein [Cyclobacteriaceae bacterium]|nr:DUF2490 domain-containing protein [Cyclobacteriaceae bacterium]